MLKNEQASLSVIRIAFITILAIFLLSACVLASSSDVKNVKIVLADNCEIDVLTTKNKVSDILEENNIVILPEENVVPNLDFEIQDSSSMIVITGVTQDAYSVVKIAEEEESVRLDKLLSSYNTIIEKIVNVEEKIPYETVTNNSTGVTENSTTKILQEGKEGLKRAIYKVKYQNDIEIGRTLISEEIVENPVNKVVEIVSVTTRGGNTTSKPTHQVQVPSNTTIASKVEGIEPIVKTMNASAYTASECGKSKDHEGYRKNCKPEKQLQHGILLQQVLVIQWEL